MLLTDIYNMCLTIPVKILEIKNNNKAIAVYPEQGRGNKSKKQEVDIQLVDKIKKGDYGLISNGFIIKKVSAKEAEEIIRTLKGG
jgi:hydrogenase assembly chaperone HypC/HupF